MAARSFHLGDALSVITQRAFAPGGGTAIRDLLTYMCGEEPHAFQIARFTEAAGAGVLAQHPQLADVDVPERFDGEPAVWNWLAGQVDRFGPCLPIEPLADFEHRHPIEDLVDTVGPDRAYVVTDQTSLDGLIDGLRREGGGHA